jgi:hypothetical protein
MMLALESERAESEERATAEIDRTRVVGKALIGVD